MRYILTIVMALLFLAGCTAPYESIKGNMDSKDNMGKEKKETFKYEYEGNTIRCMTSDIMLEASYLSPERVDLYYSKFKEGIYKNPFARETFIIFSLTVENQSKKTLSFDPRMILLYIDKGEPIQPKDYASLYALFALAESEDIDKRMEEFKATCLDNAVTVSPGQKVQGLLVYARGEKDKEPKTVTLIVNNVYLDFKSHTIPVTFEDIRE